MRKGGCEAGSICSILSFFQVYDLNYARRDRNIRPTSPKLIFSLLSPDSPLDPVDARLRRLKQSVQTLDSHRLRLSYYLNKVEEEITYM